MDPTVTPLAAAADRQVFVLESGAAPNDTAVTWAADQRVIVQAGAPKQPVRPHHFLPDRSCPGRAIPPPCGFASRPDFGVEVSTDDGKEGAQIIFSYAIHFVAPRRPTCTDPKSVSSGFSASAGRRGQHAGVSRQLPPVRSLTSPLPAPAATWSRRRGHRRDSAPFSRMATLRFEQTNRAQRFRPRLVRGWWSAGPDVRRGDRRPVGVPAARRASAASGTVSLRDLESANGTLVNGVKSANPAIAPGDVVTFGAVPFRAVLEDSPRRRNRFPRCRGARSRSRSPWATSATAGPSPAC
jgi:hypothetical protein